VVKFSASVQNLEVTKSQVLQVIKLPPFYSCCGSKQTFNF